MAVMLIRRMDSVVMPGSRSQAPTGEDRRLPRSVPVRLSSSFVFGLRRNNRPPSIDLC